MMQTKKWTSLVCMIAIFAVAACGEESANPDGVIKSEGILDGQVPPDTATDGSPPPAEYKYVKIEDLATVTGAQDGADIDAAELQKSGVSSWAQTADSCKKPDGSDCANPDKATGASDAFCTDPTKCFSNYELPTDDPLTLPNYTSLGGFDGTTSGTLILVMTDKIENGDKLIIHEVGNCAISEACTVASTTNATAESIKVSVATAAAGPWVELLAASDTNNHPKVEITVSGL